MQQAGAVQDARGRYASEYGSRCSDRLAVTFNVAAIVCHGSNTPLEKGEEEWEEEEWEEEEWEGEGRGEEKKRNLDF